MPGDVVSIQAYAKYSTPTGTGSNLAGFAAALLFAFNLTAPLVAKREPRGLLSIPGEQAKPEVMATGVRITPTRKCL